MQPGVNVPAPVPNGSSELDIGRPAAPEAPRLQAANGHTGELGHLPLVQEGLYVHFQVFGHFALGPLLVVGLSWGTRGEVVTTTEKNPSQALGFFSEGGFTAKVGAIYLSITFPTTLTICRQVIGNGPGSVHSTEPVRFGSCGSHVVFVGDRLETSSVP